MKAVVIRYFLVYLAAAFFFILYNQLLDWIFFRIAYSSNVPVPNALGYIGYFIFWYSPFLLPILCIYNFCINFFIIPSGRRWLRYIIAISTGLVVGMLVGTSRISFYIGPNRSLKVILLFSAIFFSLEAMRTLIVRIRNRR